MSEGSMNYTGYVNTADCSSVYRRVKDCHDTLQLEADPWSTS